MRFCKGTTSKGFPCIRKIKDGDKYCHGHKGEYEECAICYEDMQYKSTLMCGHAFCVACLSKCTNINCPMCRRETNQYQLGVRENVRKVSSIIQVFKSKTKGGRMKLAHDLCELVMKTHDHFLADARFNKAFGSKLVEFSQEGLECDKFITQVASYNDRPSI